MYSNNKFVHQSEKLTLEIAQLVLQVVEELHKAEGNPGVLAGRGVLWPRVPHCPGPTTVDGTCAHYHRIPELSSGIVLLCFVRENLQAKHLSAYLSLSIFFPSFLRGNATPQLIFCICGYGQRCLLITR